MLGNTTLLIFTANAVRYRNKDSRGYAINRSVSEIGSGTFSPSDGKQEGELHVTKTAHFISFLEQKIAAVPLMMPAVAGNTLHFYL